MAARAAYLGCVEEASDPEAEENLYELPRGWLDLSYLFRVEFFDFPPEIPVDFLNLFDVLFLAIATLLG